MFDIYISVKLSRPSATLTVLSLSKLVSSSPWNILWDSRWAEGSGEGQIQTWASWASTTKLLILAIQKTLQAVGKANSWICARQTGTFEQIVDWAEVTWYLRGAFDGDPYLLLWSESVVIKLSIKGVLQSGEVIKFVWGLQQREAGWQWALTRVLVQPAVRLFRFPSHFKGTPESLVSDGAKPQTSDQNEFNTAPKHNSVKVQRSTDQSFQHHCWDTSFILGTSPLTPGWPHGARACSSEQLYLTNQIQVLQ